MSVTNRYHLELGRLLVHHNYTLSVTNVPLQWYALSQHTGIWWGREIEMICFITTTHFNCCRCFWLCHIFLSVENTLTPTQINNKRWTRQGEHYINVYWPLWRSPVQAMLINSCTRTWHKAHNAMTSSHNRRRHCWMLAVRPRMMRPARGTNTIMCLYLCECNWTTQPANRSHHASPWKQTMEQ